MKVTRKIAQVSEIFRENWGPTMWSKFSRTGGDCGWLLCGNPQFVSENFRPASKLVHPPVILSIAKIATRWNGYFQGAYKASNRWSAAFGCFHSWHLAQISLHGLTRCDCSRASYLPVRRKKSYFIFSIAKITTIFTWKKCLIKSPAQKANVKGQLIEFLRIFFLEIWGVF